MFRVACAVGLVALSVARLQAAVAPPSPSPSLPSLSSTPSSVSSSNPSRPSSSNPSLPSSSNPSLASSSNPSLPSSSNPSLPSSSNPSLPSSSNPSLPSSSNPSLPSSSNPSLPSSSNPSLPSSSNPSLPSSSNPSLPSSSNPSVPSSSNPSLPSSSNPSLPSSSNPSLPSGSNPSSPSLSSAANPLPPSSTKPTQTSAGNKPLSASPSPSPRDKFFPCSDAEKVCFRHGRVFHSLTKKCYRAGTQGPCQTGEDFIVLRDPATGRHEGQCRQTYACSSYYKSLSRNGPCFKATVSKTDPEWYTCPSDSAKFLERNNFEDESACCAPEECRRAREPAAQPDNPGLCSPPELKVYTLADVYPNVKNDVREKTQIACDKEEQKCFAQKKLLYSGRCWRPLAPCGGGTSWIVVDKEAFEKDSRLKTTCVKSRCAPGRVFFGEENRCRSVWELQSVLCAGDEIVFDLFGTAHCGRRVSQASLTVVPQPPLTPATTPAALRSSASRRSTTTPRTPAGATEVCTWPPVHEGAAFGAPASGSALPTHGSNNMGRPGVPVRGELPAV